MESDSVSSPLKRRKQRHSRALGDDFRADEAFSQNYPINDVGLLMSMAPIVFSDSSESNGMFEGNLDRHSSKGRKRPTGSLDSHYPPGKRKHAQSYPNNDSIVHEVLDQQVLVPSKANRMVNLDIRNPFYDNSSPRHPNPRDTKILPEGDVNGYVKFRLSRQHRWPSSAPYQYALQPRHSRHFHDPCLTGGERIPMLPAGFGSNMELDFLDCVLWRFYHTAFCAGRSLLSQTNLFLVDYAKMADSNACVRHSVLALAATYVLDYTQEPQWRDKANYHYEKAAKFLSEALKNRDSHEVGKEDAVVASLIILTCDDIITWEMRRKKHETQRWVEGIRSAIEILDQSDPGFHYHNPVNVQNSSTRTSNANLIASFDIVARPVMPLKSKNTNSKFMWLLHGTYDEQRRIHGGTGVSPKLLHIFSQITLLAVRITKDPKSNLIPAAADRIEEKLVGFRQWSEISAGFPSEQELLDACVLNEKGQVSTKAEVTDLTAQAWVSAAQIYLQCRFHRRPRSHPAVKGPLNTLLQCIERMPCTGILFTSQSPFFPIFIMGAVSETAEERHVARVWFETVVLGLGCRSSVPPVWDALQILWIWIDQHLVEDDPTFDGPISERAAWWEQMVDMLMTSCGAVSLC